MFHYNYKNIVWVENGSAVWVKTKNGYILHYHNLKVRSSLVDPLTKKCKRCNAKLPSFIELGFMLTKGDTNE